MIERMGFCEKHGYVRFVSPPPKKFHKRNEPIVRSSNVGDAN